MKLSKSNLKYLILGYAVFFTASNSHAVRTYRHPTIMWRNNIFVAGGAEQLKKFDVTPESCHGYTSATPNKFPETLLRDCEHTGSVANQERFWNANKAFQMEFYITVTNISNISQNIRVHPSTGALSTTFALDGTTWGRNSFSALCFPPVGGTVTAGGNLLTFSSIATDSPGLVSTTPSLTPVPGLTSWITIPANQSLVCMSTVRYQTPVSFSTENTGNQIPLIQGSFDLKIEVENSAGAVVGTLYYNENYSTEPGFEAAGMAQPTGSNSYKINRTTQMFNGGSPF